jgi:hypothetical protein
MEGASSSLTKVRLVSVSVLYFDVLFWFYSRFEAMYFFWELSLNPKWCLLRVQSLLCEDDWGNSIKLHLNKFVLDTLGSTFFTLIIIKKLVAFPNSMCYVRQKGSRTPSCR